MRPGIGWAGARPRSGHTARTLVALVMVGVWAPACANGDAITAAAATGAGGSGDGGQAGTGGDATASGGGGPATTGSTGATTTGGTTATGTTTTGTSTSTGNNCTEQPCKLVSPQCGCNAGEACSLDNGGNRVCSEEGARTPGQQCGGALGDCAAGSLCVYVFETGETLSSCSRFCETDEQCDGQGSICALGLNGVDDVQLCSETCDLVSSSGCAIAGTKCGFAFDQDSSRFLNICVGAGDGVAQDLCGAGETNLCAPGFECLQTQEKGEIFRCFEWCSTAAPGCSEGLSCLTDLYDPPLTIGGVTYGVCAAT